MGFPLTPVPSYYATVTHAGRSGIYYVGTVPTVTLSQFSPSAYYVKDYYGNTVETGSVTSATLTLTGPFNPGWYRVYMTGTNTDTLYGPSYGAWSFIIVPNDSRFVTNPVPGTGTGQGGGEAHDMILKGVLGMGLSRVQIADVTNPTGADGENTAILDATLADTYWYNAADPAFDAGRGRGGKYMQFPNRCVDRIDLPSVGQFAHVLCKDETVNGANVYVEMTGSSGNYTVNIYYPNSSTLVESYPGLANGTALQAATASSNYVRAYNLGSSGGTLSPTAIGNTYATGVQSVVAAMFPYGYTYFEGPTNEPSLNAEIVQWMRLFQYNVHQGNAAAKAIGPCPVDVSAHLTGTVSWDTVLSGGIAPYCDEFSFHAYNSQTNGDINLGRATWENFISLLQSYGVDTKQRWHTEATGVYTAVFGVHHPRRSGAALRQSLLAEQYGIRRERNLVWYDSQHGFWSEPRWVASNAGPVPYAAMYRTLAAETFGMTHYHRLDFGSEPANRVWMGSLYVTNQHSLGASCLVLAMNSNMPSASVDLNITGTTSNLTYVDAFGNTNTATNSGGVVTIPTSEIPTYVRLPAGVTATVHQVNDWGTSSPPSISSYGSATGAAMNDDQFLSSYGNTVVGVYTSANTLPDTAQIMFLANATFQRVVIFCGGTWQNLSALTTFTVDTWNGTTWTTQKSIDVSAGCVSFQHGSDSHGEGCQQETYWPEQWIFDVKFPSAVTASGVRISASNASYGGEPDAAAKAAGGQGANAPKITLQEMMVLSTSTPGF